MRPAVDIVVPFVGTEAERRVVLDRLAAVTRGPGDTITLVDNSAVAAATDDPSIVLAPERAGSYFARNRGAERGTAAWLLFVDDDVIPPADLLDRYFTGPPDPAVGVLAGAVTDEAPAVLDGLPAAARYAALTAPMSQENTLRGGGRWSYAQTANCAVRRAAFEEVGQFEETVRSGGDADLCFRLRHAGWTLESRPQAVVTHRNRTTLRALVRQRARHGSGAAWLQRRYPGSFPPVRTLGTAWWSVRELAGAGRARATGHRDDALVAAVTVLSHWAFEAGRALPNHPRPRS